MRSRTIIASATGTLFTGAPKSSEELSYVFISPGVSCRTGGRKCAGNIAAHGAGFCRRCPFRLSVINDEISADFDHACSVAANDFGLQWIEIRSMWNKNVTELNADEIDRARQILEKYKLRVTDIASPLLRSTGKVRRCQKRGRNAISSTRTSTSSSRTRC